MKQIGWAGFFTKYPLIQNTWKGSGWIGLLRKNISLKPRHFFFISSAILSRSALAGPTSTGVFKMDKKDGNG